MKSVTFKADIGDAAFVLYDQKIYCGTITSICHREWVDKYGNRSTQTAYGVDFHVSRSGCSLESHQIPESELYPTREELIASL